MIQRDIIGFEGLYQITDEGQVYSMKSKKYLKPKRDKDGYLLVNLYKDGKQYTRKIHRLVAFAFIDNPEGKKEVNHIDYQRDNNCVSNLEWVTRKENVKKQSIHGGGGCYHKKYLAKRKEAQYEIN